ncbi:MAG: hypothetical protein L3K07_06120 [Thermoplasmata archaeon]|nr:hypothetical protein [Thermoplasmata archaeon]
MLDRTFPPGRRARPVAVVVALGLLAAGLAGYVYLTPSAEAKVTVLGFNWTLQQGTVPTGPHAGTPWFDLNNLNDSGAANGFPIEVASGGSLTVYVYLLNWDNVSHTIVLVHLRAPLYATSSMPPPPATIAPFQDVYYQITVTVQAPPGSSAFGMGTLGFA